MLTKDKRRLRIQKANRIKQMYRNAIFRVKVKVFMRKLAFMKDKLRGVVSNIREAIKVKKVLKIQSSVREYLWQMRWKKIK